MLCFFGVLRCSGGLLDVSFGFGLDLRWRCWDDLFWVWVSCGFMWFASAGVGLCLVVVFGFYCWGLYIDCIVIIWTDFSFVFRFCEFRVGGP